MRLAALVKNIPAVWLQPVRLVKGLDRVFGMILGQMNHPEPHPSISVLRE